MRDFYPALGDYLAAQGVGTLGSTLFQAEIPAHVTGGAVLLQETPGPEPIPGKGVVQRVQVTGLATDPAIARGKAWDVYDLLHGQGPLRMGTEAVTYCKALQRPFRLQRDESERWRWVFNIEFRFNS